MMRHLLSILAFLMVGSGAFAATIYIDGTLTNTNGSAIPVEYSTDNFVTTTTIYALSSGTNTGIFRDTISFSGTSATFAFRVLSCDRVYYYDSVYWNSSSSNTIKVSLNYCPRALPRCYAYYRFTVKDSLVTFDNQSTVGNPSGNPTYTWDFGDGNSSTSKSPSHVYAVDSTYMVCLFMQDTISKCADTFCTTVTTGGNSPSNCTAQFSVKKDSNSKYGIVIINQSKGPKGMSYLWDFGDGSSSTQQNPTHTYKSFGKFNLCLTVMYSGANCRSTYCDSIGLDSSGKMLKAGFSIIVVEEDLTSVENLTADIKIYPNPVDHVLQLDIPAELTIQTIKIVDVRGVKVMELKNLTAVRQLDVSNLTEGTYFLQVGTEFSVIQRKFSKM